MNKIYLDGAADAMTGFAEATLLEASMLCAAGRRDEAERRFAAALPPPQRAEFWAAVADALREQGQTAAAFSTATLAAAVAPASVSARIALILTGLAAGDAAATLPAADSLLRDAAGDVAALRAAALAALGNGQLQAARTIMAAAAGLAPTRPDVIATGALIMMLSGQRDQAATAFQAALRAAPDSAETAGNYAALLAASGRGEEAGRVARRAAALKPFMPAPYAVLGRSAAAPAQAADALRRAALAGPGKTDVLADLADARRRTGDGAGAAAACRAGLALQPENPGLWTNFGAARQIQFDETGAEAAYRRALAAAPHLPEAANNLARLHQEYGRPLEAAALLRQACAARPDDEALTRNLTAALIDAGLLDQAAPLAAASAQKFPEDPDALLRVGRLLCLLGRLDEAEAAFRQGMRGKDGAEFADLGMTAARLLVECGQPERALPYVRWSLRRARRDARTWGLFARVLRAAAALPDDPTLIDEVVEAFAQPGAEPSDLAPPASLLALRRPALAWLVETAAAASAAMAAVTAAMQEGELDELAHDPLLAALLDAAPIADCGLEQALTLLRRALLSLAAQNAAPAAPAWAAFAARLARQCFLNEYVFDETAEEGVAVDALGRALAGELAAGKTPSAQSQPFRLGIFAAYRPLYRWSAADRAAAAEWPLETGRLLELQIAEPRRESALAAALPQLTGVDDPVSVKVRAQYEENPYPRWRGAALFDQPLPGGRLMRALLPHAALPPTDWSAPKVLVAGCGSGREALWTATQFADARVLGLDLSLASLAYAQRQAEKLGAANVVFAQADILKLDELAKNAPANAATLRAAGVDIADGFDMIHCVGVLHHMADPERGLAALTRRLKPNGVMKLGFYSAAARRAVAAAHDLIAKRRWPDPATEMSALRRALRALPADHPAAPCRRSLDYFSAGSCRDLLFHAHERNATLAEIADLLARNDLRLLGFQLEDPALAALYRRAFPQDPAMVDWRNWALFEAERPDTFAGMYQFWAARRA